MSDTGSDVRQTAQPRADGARACTVDLWGATSPVRARRHGLGAVLGLATVFAIVVSLPAIPRGLRVAVDDVGQLLAAGWGAWACAARARRGVARLRRGWTLLAFGLTSWIVGQLYWIAVEVVLGNAVPSPSPADVGFLVAVPLEAAGLLYLAFPPGRTIERLRTSLDGALIAVSLLLIAELLVVNDALERSQASPLGSLVSLVYPVTDITLATIVVLAISRAGRHQRACLALLTASVVSIAVSDWYYAARTMSSTYQTGVAFDTGWTLGFLLIAVAARHYATETEEDRGIESPLQAAAPYVVVLGAIATAIVYFARGYPTGGLIRWTGLTMFTLSTVGLIVHRERWRRAAIRQAHDATHDALTGLPNFAETQRVLDQLLAGDRPVSVLCCDINRLDAVNASLGRAVGDDLLRAVGDRLKHTLPAHYTIGRGSSDEFIVVCPGTAETVAIAMAGQVFESVAPPFDLAGHLHAIGMTVGVASKDEGIVHADQLLRNAQHAMLRGRSNPGRATTFEPSVDTSWTIEDLRLEDALRAALVAGDELVVHFQPVVSVADSTVVGYEALVRWHHRTRGLLQPGEFIPMAELTGLVAPIGWWMLEQACTKLARFAAPGEWVGVNVAGAQLGRGELVPAVRRALDRSGLRPRQLHLEITESQLVAPTPELRREINDLHRMGVVIALDDFGTGYSSVSLLRDLDIDTIKIDRSFIRDIACDDRLAAIVHGLISFCAELGLDVIAEGVETQDQACRLAGFGCPHAQGYLYGRPEPFEPGPDVPALYEARRPSPPIADIVGARARRTSPMPDEVSALGGI